MTKQSDEFREIRENIKENNIRIHERIDSLSEVLVAHARLDEKFLKIEEHRIRDSEERREMLKEIQALKIAVSHNTTNTSNTTKLFWMVLAGLGTIVVTFIVAFIISML